MYVFMYGHLSAGQLSIFLDSVSMASSSGEVAVFADTNMGTHIAMAVSPDITAADFNREFERMHFSCFPKLGEIKVYKLMVKRKSCFYHLPESLPIKYAFQGLKGTWFLQVELRLAEGLDKPDLSPCLAAKNDSHISDGNNVTDSLITNTEKNDTVCNGSKKRLKTFLGIKPLEELPKSVPHCKKKRKKKESVDKDDIDKEFPNRNEKAAGVAAKESFDFQRNEVRPVISSSPTVETPGENSPKVISAKGNDNCSNMEVYASANFAIRTPPRTLTSLLPTDSGHGSLENKREGTAAVGKHIMIAAKNLRISGNKGRPTISLYRLRGAPSALTVVRSSVFEISGNDD